jgi:hypothetical protein
MDWMSVFEDVICNIIVNPTNTRITVESKNDLENANAISVNPNAIDARATHVPKPVTPVRIANESAAINAPTPVAPIRIPNPRAPECKIWSAKMGISTV